MKRFALFFILALSVSPASAQFWVVEDASGKMDSYVYNSEGFTVPAGHTLVPDSTVATACACVPSHEGTWDGTTYTVPESEQAPTGELEQTQAITQTVRNILNGWRAELRSASYVNYYPAEIVNVLHDALFQIEFGLARIALADDADIAHADRRTLVETIGSGPNDASDVKTMLDVLTVAHSVNPSLLLDPLVPISWVNPDTEARLDLIASLNGNSLSRATVTLGDHVTRDAIITGSYIRDIR